MEGTGLKNILEIVCGENAVVHMMTGKAVKRALRGHLLVDKCLHSQLITEMAKDDPEIQTLLDQSDTNQSLMSSYYKCTFLAERRRQEFLLVLRF